MSASEPKGPAPTRAGNGFAALYRRARAVHPEFPRFIAAAGFMAVCAGVFDNTYNNYLWEQFRISPTGRGNLEFIREFPGLMNAALMGLLVALPETRAAALAALVTGIGVAGFAVKSDNWWMMLGFTLLWGAGSHIIMPLRSSLAMSLGGESARGRRLGQVAAARTGCNMLGAAAVWLIFALGREPTPTSTSFEPPRVAEWRFDAAFYLAAAACLGGALLFNALRSVGSHERRPVFVVKRRYWLYYVMNVLFGARRQVFTTFGTWVLVTVFHQTPATFAKLAIVTSALGIFFNPCVGRLIDRWGERKVLLIDSCMLLLVCLGYASARRIGLSDSGALAWIMVCFVVDRLCFAVTMAQETYMAKIAETKEDLTASLSMGVTINHLIAMSVPSLGGRLWDACGAYEPVFLAAAGVAVLMFASASLVRTPEPAVSHSA